LGIAMLSLAAMVAIAGVILGGLVIGGTLGLGTGVGAGLIVGGVGCGVALSKSACTRLAFKTLLNFSCNLLRVY
jgi:hypothetical protein